jgi:Class III cytochrome C family
MMRFAVSGLALFCALLLFHNGAHAFECNVCHSKNPAMVRMHKATQAKGTGCFDCHRVGEKLMGKGQPKDRDSLLKRRIADPHCIECHGKPAAEKTARGKRQEVGG